MPRKSKKKAKLMRKFAEALRRNLIKQGDILTELKNPTNPWVAALYGATGLGTLGALTSLLAGGGPKSVILATLLSSLAGAGIGAAGAYAYRYYNPVTGAPEAPPAAPPAAPPVTPPAPPLAPPLEVPGEEQEWASLQQLEADRARRLLESIEENRRLFEEGLPLKGFNPEAARLQGSMERFMREYPDVAHALIGVGRGIAQRPDLDLLNEAVREATKALGQFARTKQEERLIDLQSKLLNPSYQWHFITSPHFTEIMQELYGKSFDPTAFNLDELPRFIELITVIPGMLEKAYNVFRKYKYKY